MKDFRITLIPIANSYFDFELAKKLTKSFRSNLILNGLRVVAGGKLIADQIDVRETVAALKNIEYDLLLIFQVTFADNIILTELIEAIDKPIFLWAIPEEPGGGI